MKHWLYGRNNCERKTKNREIEADRQQKKRRDGKIEQQERKNEHSGKVNPRENKSLKFTNYSYIWLSNLMYTFKYKALI